VSILTLSWFKKMNTPNWQHHSKKEQKRHLKPQALRQAKARLRQFKKRHTKTSDQRRGFYNRYIKEEIHAARSQRQTC